MGAVPLGKVLAISLALGLAIKLLLLGVATLTVGFEAARPLLFPGTGLVLAAIAFPFVRRRFQPR